MSFYLVQPSGRRMGPFTTEKDAKLASVIGNEFWELATVVSEEDLLDGSWKDGQ